MEKLFAFVGLVGEGLSEEPNARCQPSGEVALVDVDKLTQGRDGPKFPPRSNSQQHVFEGDGAVRLFENLVVVMNSFHEREAVLVAQFPRYRLHDCLNEFVELPLLFVILHRVRGEGIFAIQRIRVKYLFCT